jgi:glucokinase
MGDRHGGGELHTPEEVTRAALEDGSPRACEALDAFCAFLGSVAGNVALMFRARGGVLIGGGIVPRIVDYLPHTDFRARFESKGRFSRYLSSIPTGVIMRPDPTFLGLKALAEQTCGDAPRADGAADDR